MSEPPRGASAARRPRPRTAAICLVPLALLGVADVGSVDGQVTLPMTVEHGWPVVPVVYTETGDTLQFIVDTGAAVSALSATAARRLAAPRLRAATVQGASGPQTVDRALIPGLRVGDAEVVDLRVIVVDDETLTPDTDSVGPYDGVMGVEILSRFDVLFSEPTGELHLLPPGTGPGDVEPELDGAISFGGSTRVRSFIGHPVEVNDVTVSAILDTGARSMILNGLAAERAGVVREPGSEERRRRGVGSLEVTFHEAVIEVLELGARRVERLPARISDLPVFRVLGMADVSAMLLGASTLLGCPVFISYVEETVRYCR